MSPPLPFDLGSSLSELPCGARDPSCQVRDGQLWWARRTPAGDVLLHLRQVGTEVDARAWGPGAAWTLDGVPELVGARDDLDGFVAHDPVVARAHRRSPGLRIVRTGLVADLLVRTILEQKVTGIEAKRAWAAMIREWGEPAPGPWRPDEGGLRLPPTSARFAAEPYESFHRFGVERRRADVIRRAASRIDRLEQAAAMPPSDARARLTALPGIGVWTAAIVQRLCLGDADAVEVGDYHVKNVVGWNLAGEPRATDERMLELLAPYDGHRGRVVRLLPLGGQWAPRYGPRLAPKRHLATN